MKGFLGITGRRICFFKQDPLMLFFKLSFLPGDRDNLLIHLFQGFFQHLYFLIKVSKVAEFFIIKFEVVVVV